jgi:hypothetical protein
MELKLTRPQPGESVALVPVTFEKNQYTFGSLLQQKFILQQILEARCQKQGIGITRPPPEALGETLLLANLSFW